MRAPDGAILTADLDVVMNLPNVAGVATVDGAAYGLSPYLRRRVACNTLRRFAERLAVHGCS